MPMSSPMMKTMFGLLLSAACAAVAMSATSIVTAHCLSMFGFGFIVFCFSLSKDARLYHASEKLGKTKVSQLSWALPIRPKSNTSARRSAPRKLSEHQQNRRALRSFENAKDSFRGGRQGTSKPGQ